MSSARQYPDHAGNGSVPVCPYCTQPAVLVDGSRVGARSAKVWHCAPCRAWVPVYPNSPTNKPMGTLAKSELRALRFRAYQAFDQMWQAAARLNGWTNNRAHKVAYAWVAKEFGIRAQDFQGLGFFDEQQTRRVIELLEGLVRGAPACADGCRMSKVGRPLSEDKAYAEDLGVGYRTVLRLGGAAKLKALPPESLALLLKQLPPVPRTKGWSLRARGMDVKAPYAADEKFEAYLHELMVERGLVKP